MSEKFQGKTTTPYVGRFAPSPTGSLHFGSLVAATASYLQARSLGGSWLIRIDDIDPPREVAGSAESIVSDLGALGLRPDEPVFHQARRKEAYWQASLQLLAQNKAYWCGCSRSEIPAGPYPGTCSKGLPKGKSKRAIRLRISAPDIVFTDAVQGRVKTDLRSTCGDFVIWRADALPAYQLAAAMDDAFQGITEVVRGADLLESTPRQIAVQRALGLDSPGYAHVPVAMVKGRKLSKRLHDQPLSAHDPVSLLCNVLAFLGHPAPAGLSLERLLHWAVTDWKMSKVPRVQALDIAEISGPDRLNVIL